MSRERKKALSSELRCVVGVERKGVVNEVNWLKSASKSELLKLGCGGECSTLVVENGNDFRMCGGVLELGDGLLLSVESGGVVLVDVRSRSLLRVEGVELSRVDQNEILDLSVDGDRWEGDVLDCSPCGWGVLYDKNNERVYEGFRVGEVNVCYGASYYSDMERVEYVGGLYEGRRYGWGVQYDRNGGVVYEGKWVKDDRWENRVDKRVVLSPSIPFFHSGVEELVVSDGCCNDASWSVLDFQWMRVLKSLRVGNNCFRSVNEVRLIGLNALKRVVVGDESFSEGSGCLVLRECCGIRELKIGSSSFPLYSCCMVEANESLALFEVSWWSFTKSSLVLRDLEELECVRIGNGSFEKSLHSVIESVGWSVG